MPNNLSYPRRDRFVNASCAEGFSVLHLLNNSQLPHPRHFQDKTQSRLYPLEVEPRLGRVLRDGSQRERTV
ncbi:hypothetical protein CPC08DRAFT_244163 [Agrocybe pediades]|nr:hypothetical protein CPC08DRAFT_244163 [Agrocybe pediades]